MYAHPLTNLKSYVAELGVNEAVPWDRVSESPCQEFCGDNKWQEEQQIYQVERAAHPVTCLRLHYTCQPNGAKLRGWNNRVEGLQPATCTMAHLRYTLGLKISNAESEGCGLYSIHCKITKVNSTVKCRLFAIYSVCFKCITQMFSNLWYEPSRYSRVFYCHSYKYKQWNVGVACSNLHAVSRRF